MTRGSKPGTGTTPALPCLTITRSPANDVRVILDAFASTPVLVQLLTDQGGLIREHRAELRSLMQQLSGRLAAMIERPELAFAGTGAIAAPIAPAGDDACPIVTSHEADAESLPLRAEEPLRPSRRALASRRAPLAPQSSAGDDGDVWAGGPLLR